MTHPRAIRNRLLIALGVIVAVLGIARFAMQRVSAGPLRELLQQELSEILHTPVTVGRFEAALLPTPHLRAADIRVANRSGRSAPELLTIERVQLGVQFWPLFDRTFVIDSIEVDDADLFLEADADGRLRSPIQLADLVGGDGEGRVQIALRRLDAKRLRVSYRNEGDDSSRTGVLHSFEIDSSGLDSEISIRARGDFEGGEFAWTGRIGSLRELLKPSRPYPVEFEGRMFEARFEAKGTVRTPWTLAGLELDVTGEVPKIEVRGRALPQLGKVRFHGRVAERDGSFGVDGLHIENSGSDSARIGIDGRLGDVRKLADVAIDIDLESKSLDFVGPLFGPVVEKKWPSIRGFSSRLKLSDEKGRLDLDGTTHLTLADDSLAIVATGGIHDLTRAATLELELEARSEDVSPLVARIPGFPHRGAFGPMSATAVLKGDEERISASGIDVLLGDRKGAWVDVKGSVGDVMALRNADLAFTFGAQSLHHLEGLVERALPRTSKLDGSAVVSDRDGSLGVENLKLHGGGDSPLEIHLDARFDDFTRRDGIAVELSIRADDSRVLGALVKLDLPVGSPVEAEGRFEGSAKHVALDGLKLRLGGTRFSGHLAGSFVPRSRPSLQARLTSKAVRLQDFVDPAEPEGEGAAQPARADSKSADPVPRAIDALRRVDLDLTVRLDHVGGYRGLEASDVGFVVRLENGILALTDAGADYQGGRLTTSLHANAHAPDPTVAFTLETKSLNLERLISQFDQDTKYSGIVDADVDLKAKGTTLEALRRSLSGQLSGTMRDGNAASQIARRFVFDLVEAAFRGLHAPAVPKIGCAIVSLTIDDGIAHVTTLHLQDGETGITGTGQVDLVRGLFDLLIVPKTRNPGVLSVSPEVRVSGPLDDPTFHPLKRTLLTSLGRGLLANALKPVTYLTRPLRSTRGSKGLFSDDCRLSTPTPTPTPSPAPDPA